MWNSKFNRATEQEKKREGGRRRGRGGKERKKIANIVIPVL